MYDIIKVKDGSLGQGNPLIYVAIVDGFSLSA